MPVSCVKVNDIQRSCSDCFCSNGLFGFQVTGFILVTSVSENRAISTPASSYDSFLIVV